MGHRAVKSAYQQLANRLNRFPVGAPGQTTIYEILKILYTEQEALLAAKLPLIPQSLKVIARRLKMPADSLRTRLEVMADKGIVLDLQVGKEPRYMLAPTVVGFFEFSMMRARNDIDQSKLAGLFHQYLIEETDFAHQFEPGTQTSPFRTLVHETTIPPDFTEVLDWERATAIIREADHFAVGLCHCRHVAHHRGEECQVFPMESCLTIGPGVDYVVRHGLAREIEQQEAEALLAASREAKMVHLCDNVQHRPTFICNCCGCCCEVLGGFKKFRSFGVTFSSNFEATVDKTSCTACKKCQKACPASAIDLVPDERTVKGKRIKRLAQVERSVCLGCGVCALSCESDAMTMAPRDKRQITPQNTFARILTMAIEQNKLHELLIDKEAGITAHTANWLLGAVLSLPPTKQLLARQTLKSRFVDYLIERKTKKRSR